MRHAHGIAFALLLTLNGVSAAADIAEAVYRTAAPSIVTVLTFDEEGKADGQGSGVAIGDGRFATNCHVVRNAATLRLQQGQTTVDAVWKLRDAARDICIVEGTGLTASPAKIRPSGTLKVGEPVVAVGNPLGFGLAASSGLISVVQTKEPERRIITSAPLSPGSSGGGLFDQEGKLVGITTAVMTFGQNANIALPAEWITELLTRGLPPPAIPQAAQEPRWVAEAKGMADRGDLTALEAFAKRWAEGQPTSSQAMEFLGQALRRQKRLPEAERALRDAVRLDPDAPTAWWELAIVLDEQGRTREADEAIQRARKGRPWMPELRTFQARRLLASGKFEAARDEIDDAIRRHPANSASWQVRGAIDEKLKRFDESAKDFRTALRISSGGTITPTPPSSPDTVSGGAAVKGDDRANGEADSWNALGIAEQRKGRLADAERAYRKAIAAAPNRAEAWNNLGALIGDMGRTEEAMNALDKAIALAPGLPDAFVNRANLKIKLGQTEAGMNDIRQVLEKHPNFANAWRSYASQKILTKQYQEVVPALEKVVALGAATDDDRTSLAEALEFQGRGKEAQTMLEQALKNDPNSFRALIGLGGLHGRRGELPKAQEYLDRAIAVDSTSALAWSSKGYLQLRQGNLPEATKTLETAVRLDPNYGSAWINLGEASLRAKNVGRAIQALEKATSLLPNAMDARLFLTQAYLGSNQPAKAREQATAIMMRQPQHPSALALVTLSYLMEGNSTKAREIYDRLRLSNAQAARQLKAQAVAANFPGSRDLPD